MSEVRSLSTAARWRPALVQRRSGLVTRLAMGVAASMIFTPILGWEAVAAWCAAYVVAVVLEPMVFAPVLRSETERMPLWRTMLGGLVLFLNAAVFGSLSTMLWLAGGVMGGVCAFILLASGAIYATVSALRSAQVMALTVAPHFMLLATTPMFMAQHGAPASYVWACLIVVLVFLGYCVLTWRSIDQAHMAESKARLNAERRGSEAEAALASRSAFLAAIAHDLRTPIGAILTGSSEMQRVAGDGPGRVQAALISDAGMMMKGLLDNLLDHAKLDAGRMKVEANDFDLRTLLAQTVRLWQGPVEAKGLALRVEGAREMPKMVRGDAMRLRQILNNLFSNALKFTETGSVTLRLRGWAEEPSGHALLIEVADTGPGMNQDQMIRLFRPFDQTADGISAVYGGTGLGLTISRDLAQLMGGRLSARSHPGEGACFTVSLILGPATNEVVPSAPLEAASRGDISRDLTGPHTVASHRTSPVLAPTAASTPAPETAPALAVEAALAALLQTDPAPASRSTPTPDPVLQTVPPLTSGTGPELISASEADLAEDEEERPLRVLVVDDHDINRRAIELILTPLGCDIASAADGLAALKLCDAEAFDVIFMDVRMPELDGRETTRRLRAGQGANALAPVIAVTADTSPDDVAACMEAGMTYFVSKPLTPAALLNALQHVLANEGEAEDADQAAA